MRNKGLNIVLIIFLFGLLIDIRYLESWFYDPLKNYFESDYLYKGFPDLNLGKLFLNTSIRYILNTVISIGIIWISYRNKSFIKFSILFYLIAFIILGVFFILLLKYNIIDSYLPLFYVRRFLIQPIFILLLLPAFYYQKELSKNK